MKRYSFLTMIMSLICSIKAFGGMSNSIEYTQLYIVGDAVPTGWDLGQAPGMTVIAPGVLEWTGKLDGGKEFKFMNTREGWHKHIVATVSGITAQPDESYSLAFYADWGLDGSKDCKFKVAESGDYIIMVDLNSMRMKLSKTATATAWADKFYITGTAVDNRVIELNEYQNAEFKGSFSCKPGFLKLMNTETETADTKYFVPRFQEVDITFGEGYYSPLYPAGKEVNGWSVSVAGDYNIYLDKNSKTYLARMFKPSRALYLVGGCCELKWNYWDANSCRFYPDSERPEVMVWEGELRIGWDETADEPNKFKILTAQDWFRATYHPYISDISAEGETDARISGGDDLKWTISKSGYYRLELNTKTEKLTGTYLGSSELANGKEETVLAIDNPTVEVNRKPTYYNLQGMRIDNPSNGIYLVTDNRGTVKRYIK